MEPIVLRNAQNTLKSDHASSGDDRKTLCKPSKFKLLHFLL